MRTCHNLPVTLSLQIPFEVFAPDLYVATERQAWYLPAPYALVDPALAHPQLLADLRDREENKSSSCSLLALLLLGFLPSFLSIEVLFELYEHALQLF